MKEDRYLGRIWASQLVGFIVSFYYIKAMNKYFGSSIFKLKLKVGLKRIIENNVLLKKFYLVYRQFKTGKKKISVLDRLPAIEYDNKENPYYEDFIRIKEAVEKGITK